jgi:glycosyltransferase involved in cell wall biosynthesis
MSNSNIRVAVVHDWLVTYAGAEKVLEQILQEYPTADVYSLIDFISDSERAWLGEKKVHTSFVQKLPFARTKHRFYLPFMMLGVEQFDFSGYDLVISSSHAVAKGVITGPDQVHVCVCHSPIRYAWDLQHQYLRESGLSKGLKSAFARLLLHYTRIWDLRTANGVDQFVAVSQFIRKRIWKTYRRESTVIYPPVDLSGFPLSTVAREEFYVTCSRLVPYKRIDLIVETFAKYFPEKTLIVIGDGPERKKIEGLSGENTKLLGAVGRAILKSHLQRAKAFLFAAEEDFGIAPIEAQSSGTPVIAYGAGGALETVIGKDLPGRSGLFFGEQTTESLAAAITEFESIAHLIEPEDCRSNAERFSNEVFRQSLADCVNEALGEK